MTSPLPLAAFLTLAALPAAADMAALLTMSTTDRRDAREMSRILEAQGFTVVTTRSPAPEDVIEILAEGFAQLAPEERAIVYFGGQTAQVGVRSYQLEEVPERMNAFAAARDGVDLGPVLEALANYPGRAALLISANAEPVSLSSNASRTRVQDLPAGVALIEATDDILLNGLNMLRAEDRISLARAFREANISGYAPEGVAFARAEAAVIPDDVEEENDPSTEQLFWELTQQIGTQDAFRAYLQRYPDGTFVAKAEEQVAALEITPTELAEIAEQDLGLKRTERQVVQQNLVLLGYNTRGVDGIFGPGSRNAITQWQEDRGFDGTSFLTRNQLVALNNQAEARRTEIATEDEAFWVATGASGTAADLRTYLDRYPNGRFAATAQADLAQIKAEQQAEADARTEAAWTEARNEDTSAAYRSFLERFPKTRFAADAEARIAQLEAPEEPEAVQAPNTGQIAQDRAQEGEVLANPIIRLLAEQRLASLGFDSGDVDGRFTDATRRAVQAFQQSRNLPVTGFIGRATGVALLESATQ